MLTNLSVKNFKSWRDLPNMEFGKVTALFGPNNSGKTSLIKLLLMLKQTVESRDRILLNFGGNPQDYVNLGNYNETIYLHDTTNRIQVVINWQGDSQTDKTVTNFSLQSHWRLRQGWLEQEFLSLSNHIANQLKKSLSATFPVNKDDSTHIQIEDIRKEFDFPLSLTSQDFLLRPFYSFPDLDSTNNRELTKILEARAALTEKHFKLLLEKIYYLGPLRAQPQREYRWSGERTKGVGVLGEYTIQSILNEEHALDLFDQIPELKPISKRPLPKINSWLEKLGVASKLVIEQISPSSSLFEVRIHTNDDQNRANLVDVGFGVSQVLPIVALAYLAPPESIIILEQPELHLHPKVQAELADLFLEAAQTRNIQFIIESHSEHLLARLQRRLAERSGVNEHLTENDVKLYFCQREGSESTLQPLQLDQYGRIQNWPPDFFGDLLDERLKAMEAMAFRQHKAQTNGQAAQ